VFVSKFGPASARKVLVLVPGSGAGAGVFTLVAQELVAHDRGLAVWAVDRREEALEDTSVFAQALAGRATAQQAFDYYLGRMADSSIEPHDRPLDPTAFGFVRGWGAMVSIDDLHQVVLAARRGGRTVILGGHSLGASEAVMYATWGFAGRPGYRDLAGIVLIDGGLLGAFAPYPTLAEVKQQLTQLRSSGPFPPALPFTRPLWMTGVLGETGALFALTDPTGSSVLQNFPRISSLLPAARATGSTPASRRSNESPISGHKSPTPSTCTTHSGSNRIFTLSTSRRATRSRTYSGYAPGIWRRSTCRSTRFRPR
jgi:pimeloyl-ACP methyl ester carboxylesterase